MDRNLSLIIRKKFNMTEGDKYIAGRTLKQIYTYGLLQENLDALVKVSIEQYLI